MFVFWTASLLFNIFLITITGLLINLVGELEDNPNNYIEIPNQFIRWGYFFIIGPVLETVFFQFSIYKFLSVSFTKNWFYAYIVLSALLFAISHPFGVFYFIYSFIIGISLAILFYFFSRIKGTIVAIFGIFTIHSIINIYVTIINHFLN